MKKIIIILAMLLGVYGAFAQTTIPDNTNVSGIWTVGNSPYIIQGRAIVPQDSTLTIQQGVVVKFTASSGPDWEYWNYAEGNIGVLRVQGKIVAVGTPTDTIIFTRNGASSSYWGCVLIDATADTSSQFQYCKFEYAKYTNYVSGITSVIRFDGALSFFRSKVLVSNCAFVNNGTDGINCFESDGVEISNCNISNNQADGFDSYESNIKLINSVISGNSYPVSGYVSAIRCSRSNSQIIGNLIVNNDDFGIYISDSSSLIVNNTIYGNLQGIRIENGGLVNIHNTILTGNESNFAVSSISATINLYYSLVNSTSLPSQVNNITGNILNTSAQFINYMGGDFSLQPTSPCVNSGNPNTTGLSLPSIDLAGNPRISDARIDMGCYETFTTNAGADQTICNGQSIMLTATASINGATYLWNTGETTTSITVTPTTTTTYTVTVTNNGCTATDNVVVIVNPLPTANAGTDQTICAGTNVTLTATGGTSYSWNTGATTASITISPTATTTYTVTTNANGCSATDDVVVIVNPLPTANAGVDQTVCAGTNITLTATGGNSYSWNTSDTTASITISPTATTTYTVTVTNANGCTATDDVVVTVNPLPVVTLGKDTTICTNASITLNAGAGFNSYKWSTGVTTQTITIDTTSIGIGTSNFFVAVTNSNGCNNTDTINITFANCTGIADLSSTNNFIIYPNPSNGTFTIETNGLSNSTALSIYSIDGRLVYTEILNKPKRTISLKDQASGIYFLKLMNDENVIVKKLVIQE